MNHTRIIVADVLNGLRQLCDESVHCVVTSPPYWGLRNYGMDGQLGLERTPEDFVSKMVSVFREVRRVLRKDGTLWLNMGDSYAGSGNGWQKEDSISIKREWLENHHGKPPGYISSRQPNDLKPKDLVGIPWMLAFALRAGFARCNGCGLELRTDLWPVWNGHKVCIDCKCRSKILQSETGWYLRQDIIWSKPNPMPESVRDRCTKSHEHIFLLSKSERYFFDAVSIKEPIKEASVARLSQDIENQEGSDRVPGKTNGRMKAVASWHGSSFDKGKTGTMKHARGGKVDRKDFNSSQGGGGTGFKGHSGNYNSKGELIGGGMANKRSVWSIATKPFSEAHFATFPKELPRLCILAGTSEKGVCSKCGAPWKREFEKELLPTKKAVRTAIVDDRDHSADENDQGSNRQKDGHKPGHFNHIHTIGWSPTCRCKSDFIPSTVLDPFTGSGTTGMVALQLCRNFIGIELNPEYARMAERRIREDAPLLNRVEVSK